MYLFMATYLDSPEDENNAAQLDLSVGRSWPNLEFLRESSSKWAELQLLDPCPSLLEAQTCRHYFFLISVLIYFFVPSSLFLKQTCSQNFSLFVMPG